MSHARPSDSPVMQSKKAAAWAEALRRGQFCYRDLAAVVGVQDATIRWWADDWLRDGTVRLIAGHECRRTRKRFEVVPAGEISLQMTGDAVDQMWTVMRKSPTGFTPTDLRAHVAVPVSIEEARAYCHTLLAAGYLRCTKKAGKGSEAIYRAVNVTGTKAPRVRRLRCLIDSNTGKIIPMVEARHG